MLRPNMHYRDLEGSYLFHRIALRTEEYLKDHPGEKLYRMGVGDVSLPLCDAVIKALHRAVDDQSQPSTFHGYMPEAGAPFLRRAVRDYYEKRGIRLKEEEVFIFSGASDELGDILDLFDPSGTSLIAEPVYPAYADASVMAGRTVQRLPSNEADGFLPMPDERMRADLIYLCSPNNPTGAVYSKEQLERWVRYASDQGAVILFDAAYEAFITDENLPRSIFEIDGARSCAIEICSLSKTAGFTGTRLGYTLIPDTLSICGMNLWEMWMRNRTTKTNGVSYIIQRGGEAVFSDEGQRQIRENLNVYRQNAMVLMKALDEAGIWYCGGRNSPYIWLRCPDGIGSWEFFELLLQKIQVIGTPGEGFGPSGEGYFRFSTFASPEDTLEAAYRLKKLLR